MSLLLLLLLLLKFVIVVLLFELCSVCSIGAPAGLESGKGSGGILRRSVGGGSIRAGVPQCD